MKELARKINGSKVGNFVLKALLMCSVIAMFFTVPMEVYAGDSEKIEFTSNTGGKLAETKLVKGTIELLNDATTVALLIEAAAVVVLVIMKFIGMQQADDQEKPKFKKEIKSIIITGIIVMCISGILKAVFSYYQN